MLTIGTIAMAMACVCAAIFLATNIFDFLNAGCAAAIVSMIANSISIKMTLFARRQSNANQP